MALSKKKTQIIAKQAAFGAAQQESPKLAEQFEKDYNLATVALNEKIDDLLSRFKKGSVESLQELHPNLGPGSLLSATAEASNRIATLIDPVTDVLHKFKHPAYRHVVASCIKEFVDLLVENIDLQHILEQRREGSLTVS
jgi:phosphoglycolate phosphatase-like HAD superfamily hydrolase